MLADSSGGIGSLVALVVVLGLYFLPTIIASQRGVTNFGSIAVINLFLGWTLVGWVVALAMSFKDVPARDAPVTASTNASTTGSPEAAALGTDGSAYRNCPNCGRSMDRGATACPHCGAESRPWIQHAGVWWTQSKAVHGSGWTRKPRSGGGMRTALRAARRQPI